MSLRCSTLPELPVPRHHRHSKSLSSPQGCLGLASPIPTDSHTSGFCNTSNAIPTPKPGAQHVCLEHICPSARLSPSLHLQMDQRSFHRSLTAPPPQFLIHTPTLSSKILLLFESTFPFIIYYITYPTGI